MNSFWQNIVIIIILIFWLFLASEIIVVLEWYSLILFGLIILWLIFTRIHKRETPKVKFLKALNNQLDEAIRNSDWKKRQNINLQILWIKNNGTEKIGDLSITWSLDNEKCFEFSMAIIKDYSEVLAKNEYHTPFKPDSILPVPKQNIRKAILFVLDYLNLKNPKYKIDQDPELFRSNLRSIYASLSTTFIDSGSIELPKSELKTNFILGKKIKDNQQEFTQEDEASLKDWRQKPIKVLITDDHSLFRQGVKKALQVYENIDIIGEAENGQDLLEKLEYIKPEIILLGIQMPKMDGIAALQILKEKYPSVKIIMLSFLNDPSIISKTIELGASSYISKEKGVDDIYNSIIECYYNEIHYNHEVKKGIS